MPKRGPEYGVVVIKPDALEDGLEDDIVKFIEASEVVKVLSRYRIRLRAAEILDMYRHELDTDPSERREILMAMAAISMRDVNVVVGVQVPGSTSQQETFDVLTKLKGTTGNRDDKSTIRGQFPFNMPDDFEDRSFWFRAPFFVLNRVHIPSDEGALDSLEETLARQGVTQDMLYSKDES